MSIYEPTQSFDFQKVSLTTPTIVSGGNYFIKFKMTDDEPLYIQPPKCTTKQGFVKTNGGKKMYCDLVFSNINESFIKWVEDLEKHAQESIFKNRDKWFESQLELEDIENSFAPSLKIYKSGKMYLLRTVVPTRLGNCGLKIFNEDQTEFNIDEFKETTNVISILEIQGVKCSSKSFQLEIEIKQMMVLKPNILFDKCMIKSVAGDSLPIAENKNIPISSSNAISLGNNATPPVLNNIIPASLKETMENKESLLETGNRGVGEGRVEDVIKKSLGNGVNGVRPPPTKNDISNIKEGTSNSSGKEVASIKLGEIDDTHTHTNSYDGEGDEDGEEEDEEEDELLEIDFDLNSIDADEEPFNLKERDEIYRNIYKEAVEKAKEARNLAIYSYLEAKRIKNLYLIQET
jgi:hypothetical protein